MKIKVVSIYSKILYFLLVLLGFSSCDMGGEEYGTPTAKFTIKGKTVDKDNKAISGLKVALGEINRSGNGKTTYYVDSVSTDIRGVFKISFQDFPAEQKFVIRYEDVGREQNGLIKTIIDTVRFEKPDFTNGSGGWYAGETTKDLGTIKLDFSKNDK